MYNFSAIQSFVFIRQAIIVGVFGIMFIFHFVYFVERQNGNGNKRIVG